jgi:hypothetical protein
MMNTKSERDTNPLPYLSALPEAIEATRKQVQADLQALAEGRTCVMLSSSLLPIGLGSGIELLVAHGEDGVLRYATSLATPECLDDLDKRLMPRREFGPAPAEMLTGIEIVPISDGRRRGLDLNGPRNRISVSDGHGLTQASTLALNLLGFWPEETDFNAVVARDDEADEDAGTCVAVYLDGELEDDELMLAKNHMVVRAEFADAALVYLEHLLRRDVRCIGYTTTSFAFAPRTKNARRRCSR